MDTFLRTEEELEERFRSSNLGYRGLVGNSSRRPSEIVEKIIEALRFEYLNKVKKSIFVYFFVSII